MSPDRSLFYVCSLLIAIGIIFSFSLPIYFVARNDYPMYHFLLRQFVAGSLSIFIMWFLSRLDPDKWLFKIGVLFFIIFTILMISMPFMPSSIARVVNGAKRWIHMPFFAISPVEFFKIGFIYCLAWSFSRKIDGSKKSFKTEIKILIPYILLFLFYVFLIAFMQNDLGQIAVLAVILIFLALFAGTSFKLFMMGFILSIGVAVVAILSTSHRLNRIINWWAYAQDIFLKFLPDDLASHLRVEVVLEQTGQVANSLNAIKYGSIYGQGFGFGSYKLGFLPDVHTDFVLAGISEEIGFVGFSFIAFLMFIVIFLILKISARSENRVYHLFSLGIALMIFTAFIINSYGVSSIIPLKGIPVPFLSYGGSSLLATSIGIGMVLMLAKKTSKKVRDDSN
ncbi:FtsW/RodA/SpoVE family cell cycle protein [Campylobacter sputorum]|uniref:FtsW/RodA/SpoVE family cell cycle protein n=1 Tax=Campylobacter sputorum TaxID=206 RepID=UPI00053BF3E9|nr:FtsW/RodA/SpoVE family cell cycle protein [Campylobacter sputorum]